ncbi:MAG: AAA family ATPase, partial [Planctomycetes bacterium]|nr:AAA family ATPase [Planctomycetota bacterium]
RAGMCDAVVIDTWQSFSPCHDENDAAGMVAALSPLHHIMDAGAAVLLIHHTRKGDGNEGQASRGSGALTGFVDIIVEFRRFDRERQEDRRRVLKSYSRFDETPAEVVIELQDGGYRLVGTKGDANREDRVEVIQESLSESLATVEELRERWPEGGVAKPSKRTLQADLNAGADDGLWDRSGKGVKGSPFKYRRFDSRKPTPLEGESNRNAAERANGDNPAVNGVVPKSDGTTDSGAIRVGIGPGSICRACGHDDWWRFKDAKGWTCGQCHPPSGEREVSRERGRGEQVAFDKYPAYDG